jgi:hypothetical protein
MKIPAVRLVSVAAALLLVGCAAVPDKKAADARRSAPVAHTNGNGIKKAVIGIDARWRDYGEYLNEMLEIIQRQWYKILKDSPVSPPHGSTVLINFRITSQGAVNILGIEDAGAGKQGVLSCQGAVTDPSPYRKWSDQMIAVMGDSQEIKLQFYYQ